jgi:hypothetical protein
MKDISGIPRPGERNGSKCLLRKNQTGNHFIESDGLQGVHVVMKPKN